MSLYKSAREITPFARGPSDMPLVSVEGFWKERRRLERVSAAWNQWRGTRTEARRKAGRCPVCKQRDGQLYSSRSGQSIIKAKGVDRGVTTYAAAKES